MLQQHHSSIDKLLQTCLVKLERIDVFTCEICHVIYCEEEKLTRHLATHVKSEDTMLCNTEITTRDDAIKKESDEKSTDSGTRQPYISIRDRIMFESDSDNALSGTESLEDSDTSLSSDSSLSNEEHVFNKRLDTPRKVCTNKLTYRGPITVTSDNNERAQHFGFQTRPNQIQLDKQYSCDVCSKSFPTKRKLNAHLKTHSLKKSLTCNFCRKKFMFNHQLKVHERIHNDERPYSCKICNISFRHYSSMSLHRRSVHANLNDPTSASELPTCAICNKRCSQKSVLMQHIFKQHKGKGYPCSICKKEIGHPVALDWHMNLHKGTFKCSVCGKCHARKDGSIRCEISHKKSFVCSNCNTKFGRKDHLIRHVRDRCKRLLPNLNKECVKCMIKFCGTWKSHNNECTWKKYECDHCKKRFGTKKWMARHIINNICGKNLKNKVFSLKNVE